MATPTTPLSIFTQWSVVNVLKVHRDQLVIREKMDEMVSHQTSTQLFKISFRTWWCKRKTWSTWNGCHREKNQWWVRRLLFWMSARSNWGTRFSWSQGRSRKAWSSWRKRATRKGHTRTRYSEQRRCKTCTCLIQPGHLVYVDKMEALALLGWMASQEKFTRWKVLLVLLASLDLLEDPVFPEFQVYREPMGKLVFRDHVEIRESQGNQVFLERKALSEYMGRKDRTVRAHTVHLQGLLLATNACSCQFQGYVRLVKREQTLS